MKSLIVSIFVIAVFFMVILGLLQRRLLFPAPDFPLPASLPLNVELIQFSEGYALHIRPPSSSGPSPLVIFAHGNGETANMWLNEFQYLADRGISVLLVEYPGYAGAKGSPSSESIQGAMLDAYDALSTHPDIDPQRIFAYGRSIGGGAACQLAGQRPLAGLILESSFSSLQRLVAEKFMPAFLLRDRFDNLKVVAEFDAPILLYHGERDTLIPFSHSQQLHQAASNSKLIAAPCGHNDCPRPWSEILAFVQPPDGAISSSQAAQ